MVEIYDDIAEDYDQRYLSDDCKKENEDIKEMIAYKGGKVLDIGCGTGLLLELLNIDEDEYVGIDPSGKMLEMAHSKFPRHIFMVSDIETLPRREVFEYVICLFGVASYIKPDNLTKILTHLKPGGKYFIMFYKQGYTPEYFKGDDKNIYRGNERLIGGDTIEYHNYIIKVGKYD
jgi:ubiquinone/menaquinone biosynthesis C-methylase UbiE